MTKIADTNFSKRRTLKFDTLKGSDAKTALEAAKYVQIGDQVQTSGYTTSGDGGGNLYEIVAAGTGTDDGGSFIDLSGISGQAKALWYNEVILTNQFGAIGDGVADDTEAIQSAIDAQSVGKGKVVFPAGEYKVNGLILKDRVTLQGAGIDATKIVYDGPNDGTVFKAPSNRIFYIGISDMTISADSKAGICLDLAYVSMSYFENLLLLQPLNVAVLLDSSRGGTNFDSACVLNTFQNVKHFSEVSTGTEYGFRLIDAANSNTFIQCQASNSDVGFAIEDEVNVSGAFSNNNIFIGGKAEPVNQDGFYVNGEYNTIISPRIEGAVTAIMFGPSEKCRYNRILNPAIFAVSQRIGGLDTSDNNTVDDVNLGGFRRFFSSLELEPTSGNGTLRAVPDNGGGHLIIQGGTTEPSWNQEMSDTTFRLRSIFGGSFYDALSIENANNPIVEFKYGLKPPSVTTGNRPTHFKGVPLGNYSSHRGLHVYDETIGKPIWWNGNGWIDANGNLV